MYYKDFGGWVREQLDAGPYSDDTDAARKLGVPPSTVVRWLGIAIRPGQRYDKSQHSSTYRFTRCSLPAAT